MRSIVVLAAAVFVPACTKPNPTYCELPSDCESGVCEMHTCVAAADADPNAPDAVDASEACTSKLAWVSNRTGDYDVFVASSDGTDVVNVTASAHATLFSTFVWAPDGARLAYLGEDGLRVVDAEGTTSEPLTSGSLESDIAWAPDGAIITFTRRVSDPQSEIWRIGAEGTPPELRLSTAGTFQNVGATWSPDGQQLAFVTNRDGNYEVYTMTSTGGNPTNLTENSANDGNGGADPPQWSPDGTQISFVSARAGNRDVWVMNADGTEPRNLTLTTTHEAHPRWSPDGETIFYDVVIEPTSHVDLYAMNADGSNQRALEEEDGIEQHAEVSPDGLQIAWESNRGAGNGNLEVYVADVDGGNVQRVTTDVETDRLPAWQPCP